MHNALKDPVFLYGNRIGHNPKFPKRFFAPSNHRRPESLSDIIKEFSESYSKPKEHKGLYCHRDSSGVHTRLMRSERREMISMGCSILTHYYDVMTGEIGFRNEKGAFIRFSYEWLAEKLGVSLARVKKFFGFLKERQFIRIVEDRKKDANGNWASNISRKIIKSSFFIQTLGISRWKKIMQYRKWLEKNANPYTDKERENTTLLKDMLKGAFAKPKYEPRSNPDQMKNLAAMAIDRHQEDPSKSIGEHYLELKAKYY